MDHFSLLLEAVARLLWPLFSFTVLWLFRKEFSELVARLKRGKVLGQEFEFKERLDELKESTNEAAAEMADGSQKGGPSVLKANPESEPLFEIERQVLRQAGDSPKAALLTLAAAIERRLMQLLGNSGLLNRSKLMMFREAIDILDQRGAIPKTVARSAHQFWEIRNRLVHGFNASDDDALRAVDAGITLLRSVHAVRQNIRIVRHANLPLYEDSEGKKRIEWAHGVMLESISPGGSSSDLYVRATTRTHFKKGMRVTKESTEDHMFGPTWYRSPETGKIIEAFASSMEFVGRNVDEL